MRMRVKKMFDHMGSALSHRSETVGRTGNRRREHARQLVKADGCAQFMVGRAVESLRG
jgi:hypothetical protein